MMLQIHRCRWVRPRLALLADDAGGRDLGWDDRRHVERHLIGCASCRRERAALDSALSALRRSAAPAVVPDPAVPSIWPALARQIRAERHPRHLAWPGLDLGAALGLAAGFLVVGGLIGLTGGWHLGKTAAVRSIPGAYAEAYRPRPALPPDRPTPDISAAPKAETRLSLDLAPKPVTSAKPREAQ